MVDEFQLVEARANSADAVLLIVAVLSQVDLEKLAGKARAHGVTSAARLPSAPDIAPLAEGGEPGFDAAGR